MMDIGSLAEIASALVAVIAFGAVVKEYRDRKRQWRLGLAQELERRLESDENLSFSITCLDWAAGRVPVPELWRDIVGEPAITPNVQLMAH